MHASASYGNARAPSVDCCIPPSEQENDPSLSLLSKTSGLNPAGVKRLRKRRAIAGSLLTWTTTSGVAGRARPLHPPGVTEVDASRELSRVRPVELSVAGGKQ